MCIISSNAAYDTPLYLLSFVHVRFSVSRSYPLAVAAFVVVVVFVIVGVGKNFTHRVSNIHAIQLCYSLGFHAATKQDAGLRSAKNCSFIRLLFGFGLLLLALMLLLLLPMMWMLLLLM